MTEIRQFDVKVEIEMMVDEFRKKILKRLEELRTSGETTADADKWIMVAKEQLSKPFPFEIEEPRRSPPPRL